ncbi:MAG: hypothetical protein HIU92_08825 [Proteobacteria bacterium]|nr:hypothetical protein [Pseudomonadota bacterium]
MRALSQVIGLLLASVALYGFVFAAVLDRPLSLGTLRRTLEGKLAYAAALPAPKLVILAGSNALFSHSCRIIGPMLGLPCVNGGVALGLGLDYQFALWKPLLRTGDIVYMPMELQQYSTDRAAARAGPDAAIMLRHDWATLVELGPARWLPAAFSATAEDAVSSIVETAAVLLRPGLAASSFTETDAAGDGIGHTRAKAVMNRAFLASLHRRDPKPGVIAAGYGSLEIGRFLAWTEAHGVRAVGGWPTEFADTAPDPRLGHALAAVYSAHGALFLPLPDDGRYPRKDFFDSQDHLVSECQARHSIAVGDALAELLGQIATRPALADVAEARRCP